MDYRDITTLLIRIAGVVIIIFGIIQIPGYFLNYYQLHEDSFFYFLGITLVPVFLIVVLGAVLWLFPGTIVNKIVVGPNQPIKFQSDQVQVIAFSTLGMYILFRGVSDLVFWVSFMAMTFYSEPSTTIIPLDRYADLFATFTEIIFGMFLIFGSNGISSYISMIRGRS